MPSDADLVRAAQNGDTASLGILLERYRASLHGRALGILGLGPQAGTPCTILSWSRCAR